MISRKPLNPALVLPLVGLLTTGTSLVSSSEIESPPEERIVSEGAEILANTNYRIVESIIERRSSDSEAPFSVSEHLEILSVGRGPISVSTWSDNDFIRGRRVLRKYLSCEDGVLAFSQIRENERQPCAWRVSDLRGGDEKSVRLRGMTDRLATLEALLSSHHGSVALILRDGTRVDLSSTIDGGTDEDPDVFSSARSEQMSGRLGHIEMRPAVEGPITAIFILRWEEVEIVEKTEFTGALEGLEDCTLFTVSSSGHAVNFEQGILEDCRSTLLD